MIKKAKATAQPSEQADQPLLLPPSAGNADPTPLLTTLARVALAVARRRTQASQHDGQSEQAHEG
jgi:hypothetical protein